MTQKRVGLILIIAGLSITLFLIGATLIQDAYIWVNSINALAQKYDSFYDMIAKRETGSFLISIAIGSMLFFPGCFFRFAPKSRRFFEDRAFQFAPRKRNTRDIM